MRLRGGGEKRTLVMADFLSRRYHVTLIVREPIDVAFMERYFGVDLSRVNIHVIGGARAAASSDAGTTGAIAEMALRYREYRAIRGLKLDLLINNSAGSKLICPSRRGIFMCMFPHQTHPPSNQVNRLQHIVEGCKDEAAAHIVGRHPHAYRTYSAVTANSNFTAEWVRRYWNVEAEVVYSVCDPIGPGKTRDKIILSVGRFHPDSQDMHPKNQALLMDVYAGMPDLHREGWQLHLAGSAMEDDQPTARYLDGLRTRAAGLPIHLHVNASRETLHQLYRRASIYWHATGYGFPATEHPGKQEHFGITTVEAMSAGCVPVVINTGGQRETVQHNVNGFLWDDLNGLVDHTRRLITDRPLWQSCSDMGVNVSKQFSRDAFTARIGALTDRLLM
jgi:glycosyltransferase involved in cell wall biosynthesis